jgi:hypothetical protein
VLFLDDETTQSTWVVSYDVIVIVITHQPISKSPCLKVHELKTAHGAGIPIVVVIDTDSYNQRDLIDMYKKLGFSFLFEEQVIGHSAEYRKACYDKIRDAVTDAIATTNTNADPVTLNTTITRTAAHTHTMPIDVITASADEQFRRLVIDIYSSAEVAWSAFDDISDPPGQISRTDFKAVLKLLRLSISSKDRGKLRKKMDPTNSKFITFEDLQAFVCHSDAAATKSGDSESALADLPVDMPSLPDNYRPRADVERQVVELLVGEAPCKGSTSAVHGMVSEALQLSFSFL